MNKTVPNLYIAGFQKCGSSSLAELLNQHPEITLCNPKETFSLSDKSSSNYNYDTNIVNENFTWNDFYETKGNEKYFLEASVNNFYQKTALNYISSLDESKVIFILRDPLDRLWSAYHYYFKSNPENLQDNSFKKFLQFQNTDLHNNDAINNAVEFGKFSKYIEIWTQELGDEKIFVTSLKLLKEDLESEMNRILIFLDIKPFNVKQLPVKNSSHVIKWPRLTKFLYRNFAKNSLATTKLAMIYHKMNKSKNISKSKDQLLYELKDQYINEYSVYSKFF